MNYNVDQAIELLKKVREEYGNVVLVNFHFEATVAIPLKEGQGLCGSIEPIRSLCGIR